MGLTCPNKSTKLYKELESINSNNEAVASFQYNYITKLQDADILSKKQFDVSSGKILFTIPKVIDTQKSLTGGGARGTIFEKNKKAFNDLDKSLTLDNIDWMKVKETEYAYVVEITPNIQTSLFDKTSLSDFKGVNNDFVKNLPSEMTAVDLLNNILNGDGGKLRALARILLNFSKENNVKVVIDDVVDYPFSETNIKDRGVAMYNPKTNTIHLAKNGNYRLSSKLTALHEILHSISYHKLENDKTSRVVVDFRTLYTYATSKLNKEDYYGLTDSHEFLVALFTDERLVAKLKAIPARNNIKEYSNLFEEFMSIILEWVGIKKSNSLYEQAFAVATNIIEEQRLSSESLREASESDNINPLFSKQESGKTYGEFKIINGMPFQHSTIDKMKAGDQRVTIRTKDHPDGLYEINGEKFHVLNLGRRNIASFKNADHLKKKFKGDNYESGKFEHIDDFFSGNQNLFVYQITKIDNSIINSAVKITPELVTNPNYKATSKQDKKAPTFERQYVFFKRKLNKLKKELDGIDKNSDEFKIKKAELEAEMKRFNEATDIDDREEYVAMAMEHLKWVEELIERLPANPDKYVLQELTDAFEILNTFKDFEDTSDIVIKLRKRLFPYIMSHNLKTINSLNTSGETITQIMLDSQNKDLDFLSKNFGSLSDVSNYIGRTIGSLINSSKNKASAKNKQLEAVIQKEVDELTKYAKANGMTLDQVYDLFIQEEDDTLVLTKRYNNGKENPNYIKIHSPANPELKKFYNFYQKVLMASQMNLPYKVGKFYILNKKKSDLKSDIIDAINPAKDVIANDFISSEDLEADIIPDMFRGKIKASEKSRNLGAGLLEFAAYSNNHAAMSEILPEVRLLQEHLKYEQKADGTLSERKFISSSNSQKKVNAEDSNIFNMIKIVIDMQIKGQMKKSKSTPYKYKIIKDAGGNIISYKQIQIEDVADKMIRWNSLLRIGLSPITSITNVLFGDVSNFIEAIGGQHFTVKNMNSATNIFRKQLDYVGNKSEGSMYKWLNLLNPLQELSDYELGDEMRLDKKKMSVEKSMEFMYSMQKKGEFYLQTRTMIALLINEGYMNADGTNTKKGDAITESDAVRLSDKVQRLNQMIHGRYTQREAAILSQSILFRAAIQFRKWIPSAVENRFGGNKFDNRLGVEIEGRYITIKNKVFKADSIAQAFENIFLPLLDSQAALNRGNMSKMEIYNMRKNMVELILLTATVLLAVGLKGDDDEWKKNPIAKSGLTMLNRISGDLLFFYNPQNVSNVMKNIAPMNKLIVDLFDVAKSLPHAVYLGDYEVKRGSLKGSNEFYVNDIPSVVPGFAPWTQIQKMLNTTDILPELN